MATRNLGDEVRHLLSVLWDHRFLTAALVFICIPPILPAILYSFPLLLSTSLCVVVFSNLGSKMEEARQEMEAQFEGRPCTTTGDPPHGYGNYQLLEPWPPSSAPQTESYNYQAELLLELSGAGSSASSVSEAPATDGDSRPPGTVPDLDQNFFRDSSLISSHEPEREGIFAARPSGRAPRPGRKPGAYTGHQRWTSWLKTFEAHSSKFAMEDSTPPSASSHSNSWVSGFRAANKGRNADCLHRKSRSLDDGAPSEPPELVARCNSESTEIGSGTSRTPATMYPRRPYFEDLAS